MELVPHESRQCEAELFERPSEGEWVPEDNPSSPARATGRRVHGSFVGVGRKSLAGSRDLRP